MPDYTPPTEAELDELDLTPCPDCGACPRLTRCECDFAGLRVEKRIAALEEELRAERRGVINNQKWFRKFAEMVAIEVGVPCQGTDSLHEIFAGVKAQKARLNALEADLLKERTYSEATAPLLAHLQTDNARLWEDKKALEADKRRLLTCLWSWLDGEEEQGRNFQAVEENRRLLREWGIPDRDPAIDNAAKETPANAG